LDTKESKKVLHLITHLAIGGASENVIASARGLPEFGYQSFLATGTLSDDCKKEGNLYDQLEGPFTSHIELSLARPISPFKDLKALWRLYRFFKKHSFDVVHTHSAKAGFLGRVAAWAANVPVVVHTVHGWSFHDFMPPYLKTVYVFLERLAAKISQVLVIVTVEDCKKGLQEKIGCKSQYRVIRSGIKFANFVEVDPAMVLELKKELCIEAGMVIVGTIGRMAEQKDPKTFIETARFVCEALENALVVHVGGGDLEEQMMELIREYGLEDRIRVLGPRNDVAVVQKLFDVFILTSLWEGLPRVVLQAMVAGIPVVATEVDGVKEVIEDGVTGWLVPERSPAIHAKRTLEILNGDLPIDEVIARAKRRVEEFSEQKMVRDLAQMYEEFLLEQECTI
jgi:glycosyltransferase involved in cell wall biosynthesis